MPLASQPPRKRTTSTSTSVTSSKSNTILGPLPSSCACNSSRYSACRWPISRSVVRCPSACRSIVHVICAVSCISVAEDGPPPAAAEQVNVRAHVRERIARGLDAIHPRDGVEDDAPPLRHLVIHAGCQGEGAERELR